MTVFIKQIKRVMSKFIEQLIRDNKKQLKGKKNFCCHK